MSMYGIPRVSASFSGSSGMSIKKLKSQSQHVTPFSTFVQTPANIASVFNNKEKAENHQLFCAKHSARIVDKICLHPTCEADILICDECAMTSEGKSHANKHSEQIFAYTEFIALCKQNSCQHSDSLASQKSFNLIVADLDNKVTKYREHIRREEEKIDQEFDGVITKIVADINALRTGLKQQLNSHWTTYSNLCTTLRSQTNSITKEATSNFNLNNEYDTFLNNLTSQKNSACNFKRILTNIRPNILKNFSTENPSSRSLLSSPRHNVSISQHEISASSSFSSSQQQQQLPESEGKISSQNSSVFSTSSASSTQQLAVTDKSVNRFENQLKDAFTEFQNMTTFKPLYKNEGEANAVFRSFLAESRKLYFTFLESLPKFISIATNPAASANGQVILNENQQYSSATQQSIMGTNTSIMNSLQFSHSTMSSPLSKQSMYGSTLKPNVIASSFTPFNNIYARNQSVSEEAQPTSTATWNPSQNVKLTEGQKLSSFDHLQTVQTKHKTGIMAVVYIDSANTLATAGADKCVRVFNQTFTELACVQLESVVSSLAVLNSNDQSYILAGCVQSFAVIRVSDYTVIKTVNCTNHLGSISKLVGLADGQTVLTISTTDSKLIQWNLFNSDMAQPKKYFEHREGLQCLEQLPNRRFVATAGKDRSIKMWKLNFYKDFRQNCLEKLTVSQNMEQAHSGDITALRGSANYENILISGSSNGEIKVWDLIAGKAIQTIRDASGWVFNIIALERPHLAAVINANRKPIIDSWKENTDAPVVASTAATASQFASPKKASAKKEPLQTLASPKQKQMMFYSAGKTVDLWLSPQGKARTGSAIKLTKGQSQQLQNLQFITSSFDGTVKLWEAGKEKPVCQTVSKNLFECYPFGGVAAYQVDQQVRIVTSGNSKDDHAINMWTLN